MKQEKIKISVLEFVQDKTISEINYVNDIIFDMIIDGKQYCTDMDTSGVSFGTPVLNTNSFTIDGNTITFDGNTVELDNVSILKYDDEEMV